MQIYASRVLTCYASIHVASFLHPVDKSIELWTKRPEFPVPGPDPIKLFTASVYATLKRQPIREAQGGCVTILIGQNFSVASIEAEKKFYRIGSKFGLLNLESPPPII